jgi:hypothetical protein
MDEFDQYIVDMLIDLKKEIMGEMRQSVLLEKINEYWPEDLSMWCAPGQSVQEMLRLAAEKD